MVLPKPTDEGGSIGLPAPTGPVFGDTPKSSIEAAAEAEADRQIYGQDTPVDVYGGGYYEMDPWTKDFQERQFAYMQELDRLQLAQDQAEFRWKQAMDQAQLALSQGDFALAVQQQNDANYWKAISMGLDQQKLNLENQAQQLNYALGIADLQQRKYESDQRYQIGMANAKNEAERNAIQARWNAEQAAIAKMEDETRRILGSQQNQTAQFGAETDRASRLGTLALETNKFIADMARSPRDLFSLFFMQRGITPDWEAIRAGTPAIGDPLLVRDPLKVYTPQTAAPVFNGVPQNQSAAAVGQATQYMPGANEFITPLGSVGGGWDPGSLPAPNFLPMGNTNFSAPPPKSVADFLPPIDRNPAGLGGGVPLASLQPGLNLATVGGGAKGSDFEYPAYYDQGKTKPVKPDDYLPGGTQVWVDYTPKAAAGGVYTGPAVVGDDPRGRDRSREELVVPVQTPNGPGVVVQPINREGIRAQQRYGGPPRWVIDFLGGRASPESLRRAASGLPRFALGTDMSSYYKGLGLDQLWLYPSQNQHLSGMSNLPPWIQTLASYGAPLPPSLVAAATGNIAPAANIGMAFDRRGLGTPASLQTLGRQSKEETDLYRGYVEGPGGVSWTSYIDFISKPTQNLIGAQRAR